MYLEQITFPDQETEFDFFLSIKRTVYDSYYPFQILSARRFQQIDFEPITILWRQWFWQNHCIERDCRKDPRAALCCV